MTPPREEAPEAPRAEEPAGDVARSAGRGGLAIAFAKVYFILIGFVQQMLLTRVLGGVGYGAYSTAMAYANIADNVVIASSIQGVSRTVAGAKESEQGGAHRGTLLVHAVLAIPIGVVFFFLAPWLATRLGAAHVAGHVRVATVIVFSYCLYTPFVGALNGRRRFVAQASLDVLYATVRTALMLGGGIVFAAKGDAPLGAVAGFATAAAGIVPVAALVAGVGRSGAGAPKLGAYLSFVGPLALGQVFLNVLLLSDLLLVRRFASLADPTAIAEGDLTAGIYKGAQLFALLPYQLLLSVTFVLFPLLAKAHADDDVAAVKTYVRTGVRLSLVIAGAMVAVIVGLGPRLLALTLAKDIAEPGGATLRWLALGEGAFALYGISTTILSSLHKERWTMVLNLCAFLGMVGAMFAIVPGAPLGAPIAERAAIAMCASLGVAAVVAALLVLRVTGAFAPLSTMLRVGLAFAVTAAAGIFAPVQGKVATLGLAAVLGVVYAVALVATRELGKDDLGMVMRVLGRKKAA